MTPTPLLPLAEARSRLATAVRPLAATEVDLAAALGHRLAEDPVADMDSPPGHVSAMDGYALRHGDLALAAPLPVAFEVQAGTVPPPLPPGAAARIFTGAILPEPADTVVPQEQARSLAGGRVKLEVVPADNHVRLRGEVFRAGAPLARAGDLVTPQRLALLAAGGAATVRVVPRPRLAAVVTGTEIVPVQQRPAPGQIRDANGPLIDALARGAGLDPPRRLPATDAAGDLRQALQAALADSDLVLTSGGVSVGDYDLVPEVVRALGGRVLFHRVAIKPGKPVLAARVAGKWLLGLPGNPVSVLAGWRMLVLPLVRALAGDGRAFDEQPIVASLAEATSHRGGRPVLRPAVLDEHTWPASVRILPWHGSHDLVAAGSANALVLVEPGADLAAGTQVPCFRLYPG